MVAHEDSCSVASVTLLRLLTTGRGNMIDGGARGDTIESFAHRVPVLSMTLSTEGLDVRATVAEVAVSPS
jgi:hypothetical protein